MRNASYAKTVSNVSSWIKVHRIIMPRAQWQLSTRATYVKRAHAISHVADTSTHSGNRRIHKTDDDHCWNNDENTFLLTSFPFQSPPAAAIHNLSQST
eukprot:2997716-Amphidinium_carterae.2